MYASIDSSAGEIRILVLQPAAEPTAPIICHLQPVLLSNQPFYDALSYTWGSKGSGGCISLNGKRLQVFENLEAALRHLRGTHEPRALWIDAVCINQANVGERQEQIKLMQQVYRQAQQVCVWLGEADEGAAVGMSCFTLSSSFQTELTIESRARRLRQKGGMQTADRMKLWLAGGTPTVASLNDHEEEKAGEIRELLDRPWWKRVWVIQEAVLAENLVIMCGRFTVDWETIGEVMDMYSQERSDRRGSMETCTVFGIPLNTSGKFPDDTYKAITNFRSDWRLNPDSVDILDMLFRMKRLECTDPRDRVYGFLGFASSSLRGRIKIDYNASVGTVYQNFARDIIATSTYLDVLSCKREWRPKGLKDSVKPVEVYSYAQQGKYYDHRAPVIARPGTKPFKFWARLPPGWERVATADSCRYINHNDATSTTTSPLAGLPPTLMEHHSSRRLLPKGWTKKWDNVGRASVSYSPNQDQTPKVERRLRGELALLPSWVPCWAVHAEREPSFLPQLLPKKAWWFSAKWEASIYEDGGRSGRGDELWLEGECFDEIADIAPAWHPEDGYLPLSSLRMEVFEQWLAFAQKYLNNRDITQELGHIMLADPLGEQFQETETDMFSMCRPPIWRTWLDGRIWDTGETPDFLAKSVMAVSATPLAFQELEQRAARYIFFLGDPENTDILERLQQKTSVCDDAEGRPFGLWHFFRERTLKREKHLGLSTIERSIYRAFIKRVRECCGHRALFVTTRGYLGLAPWNARVGDRVWSLKGGKTPFLLREEPVRGYTLVGDAFVSHGNLGWPRRDHNYAGSWQKIRIV